MWEKVQETLAFIQNKTNFSPEYGVILGSGLGSFVEEITVAFTLPYSEIPNFPVSTVVGHKGALLFGTIGNKKVVAMQGRFHYYEGYDMKQVTFPVRVMKYLGVSKLIVSNASGGVNPLFHPVILKNSVFVSLEGSHQIRDVFTIDVQHHLHFCCLCIQDAVHVHDHGIIGFYQSVDFAR